MSLRTSQRPANEPPMSEPGRRLIGGPYSSPSVGIRGDITCVIRGPVTVAMWTEGRIPWPCAHERGHPIVLCGDLVRAVRVESSNAVIYHWGVCGSTVLKGRRALGTPTHNEGTRALHRELIQENITPEAFAHGQARLRDADVQATIRVTKSKLTKCANQRVWTPEEDALLGTVPDNYLTARFGCALGTLAARRRLLAIPATLTTKTWRVSATTRRLRAGTLYALRVRIGKLQGEIADLMGVRRGHYARLETGKIEIVMLRTVERLAAALRCDPAEFVHPYP